MIAIHTDTVADMNGCGRAANEDGTRHQMLQMSLGCEKPFPLR
jgi:hypothetical protein